MLKGLLRPTLPLRARRRSHAPTFSISWSTVQPPLVRLVSYPPAPCPALSSSNGSRLSPSTRVRTDRPSARRSRRSLRPQQRLQPPQIVAAHRCGATVGGAHGRVRANRVIRPVELGARQAVDLLHHLLDSPSNAPLALVQEVREPVLTERGFSVSGKEVRLQYTAQASSSEFGLDRILGDSGFCREPSMNCCEDHDVGCQRRFQWPSRTCAWHSRSIRTTSLRRPVPSGKTHPCSQSWFPS